MQTLQGYIFSILQHFVTKFWNFTDFNKFFTGIYFFCLNQKLVWHASWLLIHRILACSQTLLFLRQATKTYRLLTRAPNWIPLRRPIRIYLPNSGKWRHLIQEWPAHRRCCSYAKRRKPTVGSRPAFRAGQKPAIGKKCFFLVYSIRDLTCCFKVNLTL
jgi:hypothetical protein